MLPVSSISIFDTVKWIGEEIAKVSDDANELSSFITDIYGNAKELEKMAEAEHQYIIDNYSVKNAVEILGQDFAF